MDVIAKLDASRADTQILNSRKRLTSRSAGPGSGL